LFGFRLCVFAFVCCKLNRPYIYLVSTKQYLLKSGALFGAFWCFWTNAFDCAVLVVHL